MAGGQQRNGSVESLLAIRREAESSPGLVRELACSPRGLDGCWPWDQGLSITPAPQSPAGKPGGELWNYDRTMERVYTEGFGEVLIL